MREVGLAVIATVVLVVLGTHVVGGPIPMLWVHAVVQECDGTTQRRCVATVPASVTRVRGDAVTLSVPSRGSVQVSGAAQLRGSVRVGVLDSDVLWVEDADGKRVEVLSVPAALLRFGLVSVVAIAVVCAVGRFRAWWVWPAAGSVVVGSSLGIGAGAVAVHDLAMPVLFGVTTLASLAVAYVWMVHLRPALDRA